jgi:hypothetical protein
MTERRPSAYDPNSLIAQVKRLTVEEGNRLFDGLVDVDSRF